MNLFEQTQVLSSLAGVPRWQTRPEPWEHLQAVPMLEKRQKGRARLRCLSRRPDSVPSGCGSWPGGRESWGQHCLLQGWVLSVCLEGATGQAAALPPRALLLALLSFVWWDNLSQRVGACLQAPARGGNRELPGHSKRVLQA